MKKQISKYLLLYGTFFLYSLGGICTKLAGQQVFLSLPFCLLYFGLLCILAIYAFLWQRVLKCFTMMGAYANKSIVIPLGMVWGWLVFGEEITWTMFLGVAIIMFGVCVVVTDNGK